MSEETKKLYRSRSDRMIAGVCGGLGKYIGIDPTVIRVVVILATFFTFPAAILLYIILMLVVPEDPEI